MGSTIHGNLQPSLTPLVANIAAVSPHSSRPRHGACSKPREHPEAAGRARSAPHCLQLRRQFALPDLTNLNRHAGSKRKPRQVFNSSSKPGPVALTAQPPPSMSTLLLEPVSAKYFPVMGNARGKGIQDVPVAVSAFPTTNALSAEPELEPGFLAPGDVMAARVGVLENGFWDHRVQLTSKSMSISMRQWSLGPQSSGALRALVVIRSWKPREANT